MKKRWAKYLLLLQGILFFLACNNGAKGPGTDDNPIFKDPVLKEITQRLHEEPTNAALYYQRGDILHRMKQDTLALHDFERAVELDSTQAAYYSAIGELMFEHKDITSSVEWLKKAIKLNPADPRAHLKIAKMFVFTKDYPKAFEEINTVLKQDVYNPEAYFLKGMIYKNIKDTGKAISSFQTAINVAPDHRESMLQLGHIFSDRHDPAALKYFDNAFKLDTMDVSPLYNKGMYYQAQERYEEAKAEYKNCILHDPDYADAYFNTGWILMHQDSLEKAKRQYDLATKRDPINAGAYYNRGLCNELLGHKDEAIADYKQALTFNEKYKEAKEGLARLGAK